MAEDYASAATIDKAYIVCIGGRSEWANYGLGDYMAYIAAYDYDGTDTAYFADDGSTKLNTVTLYSSKAASFFHPGLYS